MKHLMVDLETLDTASTAVILSIGAIWFDEKGLVDTGFHVRLEIDPQIKRGRTIAGGTVDWWMNQSEEARTALFSPERQLGRVDVPNGLDQLARYIGKYKCDGIWGNGADFDCVLLGSLYDTFNMRRPWSYSKHRCFRTLKALYGGDAPVREGTHHDALDDAQYQAKWAAEILGRVKA